MSRIVVPARASLVYVESRGWLLSGHRRKSRWVVLSPTFQRGPTRKIARRFFDQHDGARASYGGLGADPHKYRLREKSGPLSRL